MSGVDSGWNIIALANVVKSLHGDETGEKCNRCLQSLTKRKTIACFHVDEFRRRVLHLSEIAKNALPGLDPELSLPFAALAVSANREAWSEVWRLKLEAEAHIIAFAQSVHAMADILAASIYYAFGERRTARIRDIRDVSISKIAKHLGEICPSSSVGSLCESLRLDARFVHVADFVNASKHEHLVECNMSADFEQGRSGFRVNAFPERAPNSQSMHSRKWVDDFIKDLDQLCKSIHEIGLKLNEEFGC